MKKGPLSKKEKEFIDNNVAIGVPDLATKLDRSTAVVSRYVETITDDSSTTSTHNLFARKKERGVTVMTEAASMASDDNKKARKTEMPARHKGAIHKIREDGR
tara:strand:+ start:2034 stop:2342 length:309 start_codon:yes stop_codon:yes gene_type:complete